MRRPTAVQTGQPIKDLEEYLGAWAHMLMLSEDLGDYAHAHATLDTTHPGETQLTMDLIFPRAGKSSYHLKTFQPPTTWKTSAIARQLALSVRRLSLKTAPAPPWHGGCLTLFPQHQLSPGAIL